MAERYFVSYFGNFEGGVGVHSTVVLTVGKLETGEPVVILSLYHMCTIEEQEEETDRIPEWIDSILDGCGNRCWCCGQSTAGEVCQQCGKPLCSMCVETRAGFCMDCPTEDYKPYQEEEEEG